MKTITLVSINSMKHALLRHSLFLIPLVLFCSAFLPQARAVCQRGCDLAKGNTFLGDDALAANTDGSFNTAIGFHALFTNTTGNANTANGFDALLLNTTGTANTAIGETALFNNTTGVHNTASGNGALFDNTTGNENTATGVSALLNNTTGADNTATGVSALLNNTIGADNTATGLIALFKNTTGIDNTATGTGTLYNNTTGNDNTAEGYQALFNNAAGDNNIALGNGAGFNLTSGNNNIDLGNAGVAAESNTIRIGTAGTQTATFIAGIRGVPITGGQAMGVNADGQLGVKVSSARFKEAIKPMDQASAAIFSLKPVAYRYKKALDPTGASQFGLVAEDVAKVNRDLVIYDDNGKPFSVRYEEVNAMLLNEFLKEHQMVQELKSAAAKQEAMIALQQKQIEALTMGLQKVNAQIEASGRAPQMVNNN